VARNLQILDDNLGISANVKYEPLNASDKNRPKVAWKAPNGKTVSLKTVDAARQPIQTFKAYLDEDLSEFAKAQLTAFDPATGNDLCEFESTTVFDIVKYEPEVNYTDRYIVEKYYELFASDDGKKKDVDREIARNVNRQSMKKIYDHLVANNVVGKAEFVASSGHYRAGAGYIRAITFDGGKWSLELGAFKEEKVFKHLNEPKIEKVQIATKKAKPKNALL
jgi:hypothetical protein